MNEIDRDAMTALSRGAFEAHKSYTPAACEAFLDELAGETLADFSGTNSLALLPTTGMLAPTVRAGAIDEKGLRKMVDKLTREKAAILASTSWRITMPIRAVRGMFRVRP